MLRDKLLAPAEASTPASPGVSTPPPSPAGTHLSPADSPTPGAAPAAPTSDAPKSSPEKVLEPKPAGPDAGSPDFESLLGDDDELEVDIGGDEPPAPPAVAAKPDKTEPTPPASPAVEPKAPTPPAAPTPPPVAVTPPAQPPAVQPPVQPPQLSLEEQETEWRNMRQKAEEQLLKTYELSKDESDALMVDPGKVFPKLAAKIHMQAFEAAVQVMTRNIPGVIQGVITQQSQANERKEQFFTKFPALRQHEDIAGKFIMAYRNAAGPEANPDDIANQAGVAAYVHLRLPLEGLPGIVMPSPSVTPPATPPAPFTPAPPATGAIPSGTRPANVYTQLAEEFAQDDS